MDYCFFGTGDKTFVLIPGLSTAPITPAESIIAAEYAALTDDYTIYLFDRRNEIPESYSIEEMAEDTAEAMLRLGLDDICLCGASQGGMIAQLIAERYPNLVSKLIIESSSSRPNAVSSEVIGQWIRLAGTGDGEALNRDMIYKVYSPAYIDKYSDLMQAAIAPMSKEALNRFITFAEPILTFDHYEDLSKIKCKTLIIGAEGDNVLSVQPSRDMAEKLGCECYIYGNEYGHAVYDEAPDCVLRILDFIKKY